MTTLAQRLLLSLALPGMALAAPLARANAMDGIATEQVSGQNGAESNQAVAPGATGSSSAGTVGSTTSGMTQPAFVDIGGTDLADGSNTQARNGLEHNIASATGSTVSSATQNTGTGNVTVQTASGTTLSMTPVSSGSVDLRADGLYPNDDGTTTSVTSGTAMKLAPSLVNLAQLVALLPAGANLSMSSTGVLTADVGGETYSVLPSGSVTQVGASGSASVTSSGGALVFTDDAGNQQTLSPAFEQPDVLVSTVAAIAPNSAVSIQPNGTASGSIGGSPVTLVPGLTLLKPIPAAQANLPYWPDPAVPGRYYINNRDGTAQAVTVTVPTH